MTTATLNLSKTQEKARLKRLKIKHFRFNSQPGNRAWRRKMAALERGSDMRKLLSLSDNYRTLVSFYRTMKVERRIARAKARKVEREAEPEVANKLRTKRLKEKKANHRIMEKNTLRRIKYRARNRKA